MSDERWKDDANANDPRAPYLDRKPYRAASGKPTKFNLSEEVERFMHSFFGAAPKTPKKGQK